MERRPADPGRGQAGGRARLFGAVLILALLLLCGALAVPSDARADFVEWGTPYIGLNNIWGGPPPENNFFVLPEHNNMPVSYGWMGWADVSNSKSLVAIWRRSRYFHDGEPRYQAVWTAQSRNGGQPLAPGFHRDLPMSSFALFAPGGVDPNVYYAQGWFEFEYSDGTRVQVLDAPPIFSPLQEAFGGRTYAHDEADPINTASGNAYVEETDLALPALGSALVFSRTYNSQGAATDGPLGFGWTHSYRTRLLFPEPGVVRVIHPDERSADFTEAGGGAYTAPPGSREKLRENPDGTFDLVQPDQSYLHYDASGRLSELRTRYGQATTLTYQNDLLTQVADPSGQSLTLSYQGGRITRVEDHSGRAVLYAYDGSGDLVSVTDPNQHATTYTYDASHQLLSVRHPEPSALPFFQNHYTSGRADQQTDALGGVTTFSYDTVAQQTQVTDPRGKTATYEWDTRYRSTRETDPYQHSRSFVYGSLGLPISTTDENGHTSTFTYDANGNLIAAEDPATHTATAAYDAQNNNLLWAKDALLRETTFTYDATGTFLDSITTPLGTTAFTYFADGRLHTLSDALLHTWTYAYNAQGDPTSVTDPLTRVWQTEYDAVGRATAAVDPNGSRVEVVYDPKGNLTRIKDPLAQTDPGNRHQVDITYDANDNQQSVQDANGNLTLFAYNDMDLLTGVTDALSGSAAYGYDPAYNLTSVRDPRLNTTTYTYDDANRLKTVTDPLSRITELFYDPAGNVTKVQLPNGAETSYTYTGDDLLRTVAYLTDPLVYTFAYSPTHTLASVTTNTGKTWSYLYDAGDRPTQASDQNNPALSSFTVASAYDAVSNRTSLTVGPLAPFVFTYNARNELATLTGPGGESVFTHDPGGRLTLVQNPGGRTRSFTYDAASRVTQVENQTVSGTETFAYTYDAAGNVLSENQQSYTYDALNRLRTWSNPSGRKTITVTYAYDASGNLLTVKEGKKTKETYTYNAANQITNSGFTYDANGNLTADGTYTYLYDQEDRLKEVKQGSTSLAQMTYDFLGRRTSLTAGGQTTFFHYDGIDVVAETDAAGAIIASYTYGPAGILSMTRGGQTYFYQTNAHGDVVALTNSAGTIVNTYTYDPWGKVLSASEQMPNPYRYAGYRYDASTGLYYLWNRYYDPGVRRFLSPDPAEANPLLTQSLNPYAYALDNPASLTDPTGLVAWGAAAALGYVAVETGVDAHTLQQDLWKGGKAAWNGNIKKAAKQLGVSTVDLAFMVGVGLPNPKSAYKVWKVLGRLVDWLPVRSAGGAGPMVRVGRLQYTEAVGGLEALAQSMRASGASPEEVARALHAERRAIGERFKDLTPEPLRARILQRNIRVYGDPLGPSVEWLREHGRTWEQIIESASRPGGRDLGF